MKTQQTIMRGRVKVILDRSQVVPDNPGEGTPALVGLTVRGRTCWSTYWLATDVGAVEDGDHAYYLTADEIEFLDSLHEHICQFLYSA